MGFERQVEQATAGASNGTVQAGIRARSAGVTLCLICLHSLPPFLSSIFERTQFLPRSCSTPMLLLLGCRL
jgi:hypothetical protein